MSKYRVWVADAENTGLQDNSVDLVFGSPPYLDARTYGIGAARDIEDWVAWMLRVTDEALRIARNCVMWVVAGKNKKCIYRPAPEMLMAEMYKRGLNIWRPAVWVKNGFPNYPPWHLRNCFEYVICVGKHYRAYWYSWDEVCKAKCVVTKARTIRAYSKAKEIDLVRLRQFKHPETPRPSNVIDVKTGGANLGHALAWMNEAAFPVALPEFFIRCFCPPEGIVYDPFIGSGSTMHAAWLSNRIGWGSDIRESQAVLCGVRMREVIGELLFEQNFDMSALSPEAQDRIRRMDHGITREIRNEINNYECEEESCDESDVEPVRPGV